MKQLRRIATRLVASVALSGALIAAQDWKTADKLAGVDLSGLTAAQKTTVLKLLRAQPCSCGCGDKLAECRVLDPTCSYSTGLAAAIVDAIKSGKTADQAIAAAAASKWAHVQEPKLLDDPVTIPTEGAPFTGPANARITLVEFSDFECPYCAAAVPQIKAILKAYPQQVKLIFKEYPLETHSHADLAAAAALAAHKQGKFWAMHDAMYAHMDDLSRKNLLALAKGSGLNMDRFETDIDSTEVREAVVRDVQDGNSVHVEGTPTMFVNGQHFNGPIDLASLKPILDEQLKTSAAAKQSATIKR